MYICIKSRESNNRYFIFDTKSQGTAQFITSFIDDRNLGAGALIVEAQLCDPSERTHTQKALARCGEHHSYKSLETGHN